MFILAVPHEAINSLFFIPIIFRKKKNAGANRNSLIIRGLGNDIYWELKQAWPCTYGADLSENHRQCSRFYKTSPKEAPLLILVVTSCSPAAPGILLQVFYLDFSTGCQSSNEAWHLLFLIPQTLWYREALLIGCSIFIVFVKKGGKGRRVGKRKRSGCIKGEKWKEKSRRKVKENKKKIWNCWQLEFSLTQKVV